MPSERARVVAHRGFSGAAPENTVAAVRAAIEVGADMAEVDVTLTSDGHVVCLHDEKVDRTTDGKGRITEITLEQVQDLDAGSWFSPSFAGEPIPTLDEVLEVVNGSILLNIEIKTEVVDRGIAAKVVARVREHEMVEQVMISSFSPRALFEVRKLDGTLTTASLFNRKIHRGVDPAKIIAEVGSQALNINRRFFNRSIRQRCAELEIPVGTYTANKPRHMEKLLARGVHAIYTDHPDVLLNLMAADE